MIKKKVCMVGQFGVGKTSLVRRFVNSLFDERYLTTVGVKIDSKVITVGSSTVTMMLWDLAGEDDLAQLNVAHLRGASGYILVVDGCRAKTLTTAVSLQDRIQHLAGPVPFVLVLNKADLREQWEIQPADVDKLKWKTFETSAKSGTGVEDMFHFLAEQLLKTSGETTE
jgi:small GTP-binding protein